MKLSIALWTFLKSKTLISIVRMLEERSIVLDFEGPRCRKNNFIVKELAITTSD